MGKKLLWLGGIGGVFLVLLMVMFPAIAIILIVVLTSTDDSTGSFDANVEDVSAHVLEYKDTVQKYADKQGIGEYTPVILGIMQQESGGNPDENDPMQSSESLCGEIGCIKDSDHSIKQGVDHFNNVLEQAEGDVFLAIHSYNYGTGFIDYVLDKDGEYEFNKKLEDKETYDLALEFSQEQYKKEIDSGKGGKYSCLRKEAKPYDACYGDPLYVWSVKQYVNISDDGEIEDSDFDGNLNMPVQAEITSGYGPRESPGGFGSSYHRGIDLGVPVGTKISSSADGKIIRTETGCSVNDHSCGGGWGNHVIIRHDVDGETVETVYAHLNTVSVSNGDTVKAGDNIGKSGNTGASKGPHLHFEIHPGGLKNAVDPMTVLSDK